MLLSGIRVIELGQVPSAPYAAMLLADLCAEVIKIAVQSWGPRLGAETDRYLSSS